MLGLSKVVTGSIDVGFGIDTECSRIVRIAWDWDTELLAPAHAALLHGEGSRSIIRRQAQPTNPPGEWLSAGIRSPKV